MLTTDCMASLIQEVPTTRLVWIGLFLVYGLLLLWWWDAPRRIVIFVRRNLLGDKKTPRLPPGNVGFPIFGEIPLVLMTPGADKLNDYRVAQHKKYGEIYCSSIPPLMSYGIVVNSEQALKWAMSMENRGLESEWDEATSTLLGEHSLAILTGKAHKRMRSALIPVFQPAYLRDYAASINDIVKEHLREGWTPAAGEKTRRVCTRDSMKQLMFTVIAVLVLGLDMESDRELISELIGLLATWFKGLFMPTFRFPGNPYFPALKARKEMKRILLCVVNERRASKDNEKRDVLGLLLQPRMSDNGEQVILTNDEIFDILLVMLFAGTDTTACTMTWVIKHLNENPDVLARLREEHIALKSTRKDPNVTDITWDEVETLRYTNQLIFESLRMNPPVAGTFRRVKRDLVYNGYLVPKGYKLSLDIGTITKNPQYHNNGNTFNPDRFESQQAIGGLSKPGFKPFSGGSRMCIGYRLAITEMNVIVHHLVVGYSWNAAPETKDDVSFFPIPMPVDGVPIDVNKHTQ